LLIWSAAASGFRVFGSHHIFPIGVSSNSIVVDIGGNKGEFYSSIRDRYDCRYYFIEADPTIIKKFEPDPNLFVYNLAISASNSQASFYISNNSEANSFNKTIAGKYGIKEVINVNCLSLQEFCARNGIVSIQLLKMDVEGAEIEIFESLSDDFLRNIDQITVEFHEVYDSDLFEPTISCIKRMSKIGFIPVVFGSNSFEDVVFLNRKKLYITAKQNLYLKVHNLLQYMPGIG
jgi:FkbM family methyltransferase